MGPYLASSTKVSGPKTDTFSSALTSTISSMYFLIFLKQVCVLVSILRSIPNHTPLKYRYLIKISNEIRPTYLTCWIPKPNVQGLHYFKTYLSMFARIGHLQEVCSPRPLLWPFVDASWSTYWWVLVHLLHCHFLLYHLNFEHDCHQLRYPLPAQVDFWGLLLQIPTMTIKSNNWRIELKIWEQESYYQLI